MDTGLEAAIAAVRMAMTVVNDEDDKNDEDARMTRMTRMIRMTRVMGMTTDTLFVRDQDVACMALY